MADHMFAHNDEVHSDINFIRMVHDWEVDYVSSFINLCLPLGWVGEVKIMQTQILPCNITLNNQILDERYKPNYINY